MANCTSIEFWSGQADSCVGNLPHFGAANARWKMPRSNTEIVRENHFQVLTQHVTHRFAATDNVKSTVDGTHLFFRTNWYAKMPQWHGGDSLSRRTYTPLVLRAPSTPAGTARVLARFGYNRNFHCSVNRTEVCYATQVAVNETTPFLWESELTASSGLGCSADCTVTIPAYVGEALYYQLVYRDAAGATILAGPVQVETMQ